MPFPYLMNPEEQGPQLPPQPERAVIAKYPPDPQDANGNSGVGADLSGLLPPAAQGWQNPGPQIINGAASAAYQPSVTPTDQGGNALLASLKQGGVGPGQFSSAETAQMLSPSNVVNGNLGGADVSRFIRLGGGQLQDANPQAVAQRQQLVNQMIGIGQKNQDIGIEQQKNDLTGRKLDYDLGRNKIRDQFELGLMAKGLSQEDMAMQMELWDRNSAQTQARQAAQSQTGKAGGQALPQASPATPPMTDLPLDIKSEIANGADAPATLRRLYSKYGPQTEAGPHYLIGLAPALQRAIGVKHGDAALADFATAGLLGKPLNIMGAGIAGAGALLGGGSWQDVKDAAGDKYNMPLAEGFDRGLGDPGRTSELRAFVRQHLLKKR